MKRCLRGFTNIFIIPLILLFLMQGILCVDGFAYERKVVLFISSYSYDWGSVPHQMEGVYETFGDDYEIKYRFMNTKNMDDELAERVLSESLHNEIEHGFSYDAVILGDDAALNFAMNYHNDFFANIPVVYFGINAMENAYYATATYGYTGVIEQFSVSNTVRAGLAIYPDATNVVGIVDDTVSGKGCEQQFIEASHEFENMTFTPFRTSDMTEDEIKNALSQLKDDTILIYLIFNMDGQGNSYSSTASTKLITESANIPVLRTDDLGLGDGILGGDMICQKSMAEEASKMVLEVFGGKDISEIQPILTTSIKQFDKNVMDRFNIKESQLPEGSVVINRTPSVFERNAEALRIGIPILLMLLILLIFFIFENIKIKRLNNSISEKDEVLDSLIDTTIFRIFNDKMDIIYYSRGVPLLSGRTAAQYEEWVQSGCSLEESVHPGDIQRFQKEMGRLLSGEAKQININYRLKKINNDYKWVTFFATQIRVDEDGAPVYAGLFTGMSDEAKMYRKILKDSYTGVFVVDDDSYTLLYINDAMHSLGIVRDDEAIGKKCYEVFYGKDKPCEHCRKKDMVYSSYISFDRIDEAKNRHFVHKGRLIDWNGIPAHIEYITDDSENYFAHLKTEISQRTLNEAVKHSGMGYWEYYPAENKAVWGSKDALGASDGEPYMDNFPESWFAKNITAPESVETLRKFYEAAKNGESEGSCDVLSVTKGKRLWERLRFSSMKNDAGETIKVIITSIDISKEKKAEENFQRELARKSALEAGYTLSVEYNVTRDLVVKATGDDSSILKTKCTIDASIKELVDKYVMVRSKEFVKKELSRKELLRRYDNNERRYEIEMFIKRDDKQIRCYSVSINMIKKTQTDDICAFIYALDITDGWVKKMVTQSVVERKVDSVSYLNVHSGVIRMVRHKHGAPALPSDDPRLYTDSIKEYISKNVPPEEREHCFKAYDTKNIIERLESFGEYTIIHSLYSDPKQTERRRVKISLYYLDRVKLTIVFVRTDITDIYEQEREKNKQLEAALNEAKLANRAKSDFLSRMSHEIRTPMNAVLGMADIGAKEIENEKATDYFRKISFSGKYLLGLINDILDMSKIESQKVELRPEIVNINSFIDSVIAIVAPLCDKKSIKLNVDRSKLSTEYSMLDAMRMQQILINLLGNAIKFSEENSEIDFEISCQRENSQEFYVFVIRDYGVGMSKEFLSRAFVPFEQERNKFSSGQNGTGLGLAISKNLVGLMNGSISVESSIGEGSAFTVKIPIVPPDDKQLEKQCEGEKGIKETTNFEGKRFLLVEDNMINAEIAITVLEAAGATVEHARDGAIAVDMFRKSEPSYYDIILMDIRMPHMDGIEATRIIRSTERSDAETIPIIAMTANVYDDDVKQTANAGMNAHISKPIDVDAMLETLKRFI